MALRATMVECLHCSTRNYKVLCSNLSISFRGMILDKVLTSKLSRMTHSYRASVSMLDESDVDIAVCKNKKTGEMDYMWVPGETAAGPNGR